MVKMSHFAVKGVFWIVILFSMCACTHNISAVKSTENKKTDGEKSEPQPQYLDFGDILIPSELKVNTETSFVFRTSDLTAGVLALKGRVTPVSLVAFFEANMPKDNWQLISSFKSPRMLLLYRKDARWCVINIFERDFYTNAEIWVSPTIGEMGSGLFK